MNELAASKIKILWVCLFYSFYQCIEMRQIKQNSINAKLNITGFVTQAARLQTTLSVWGHHLILVEHRHSSILTISDHE
jgi:DNA replicative helicase MCM subunit Mcm2 (Cdc46/Mcm family)